MLSLILAAITMTGSITSSVSHVQGHVTPMGGQVFGAGTTTTRTIPARTGPPGSALNGSYSRAPLGTQTIRRCYAQVNGHEIRFVTDDPRGCAYGSPLNVWF